MPNYALIVDETNKFKVVTEADLATLTPKFALSFTCYNYFSPSVQLQVSVHQIERESEVDSHSITLSFVDTKSDLVVYSVQGVIIDDEGQSNSILNVLDSLDDFDNVFIEYDETFVEVFKTNSSELEYYNPFGTLGRKKQVVVIPTQDPIAHDTYTVLTRQDDQPTVMYMALGEDINLMLSLLRVANRLNVRLWVELDPSLTYEQVVAIASQLQLFDHHICLLWAPILARPVNAIGLKGKKSPRHAGGVILAEYLKRQANTNSSGIPAIHRPIAGFDYPIAFVGIQQNPAVYLDDPELKKLADLMVNVVKRERFPNGIRFVLNDSLTAYGDNKSVLKLANASEISMLIDNRLIEICKRHLLKHIEGTIEDSIKEAVIFLDSCTTKDRPLLRKSKEIGGFYNLSITPSLDRPNDKIDIECAYHPQGVGRAIFLKTSVTA